MTRQQLMIEIMVTCHSLALVNNKLIGDPLDIKMFEWTKWILEDNNENKYDPLLLSILKPFKTKDKNDFDELKEIIENDNYLPDEIAIIRRFEFSSKLQRMSVIVRNLNENKFRLHIKGSPEKLRELCDPNSIPSSFHKILNFYTSVIKNFI